MTMPSKSVLFAGLAALLIGAQISYGIVVSCIFGIPNAPGAFGDMFGAFSALLSGLGFIGVVLTLLHQIQSNREEAEDRKKTDDLQREHLKNLERQLKEVLIDRKRDELLRHRERLEEAIEALNGYRHLARTYIVKRSIANVWFPDAQDSRARLGMLVRLYAPAHFEALEKIQSAFHEGIVKKEKPDLNADTPVAEGVGKLRIALVAEVGKINAQLAE